MEHGKFCRACQVAEVRIIHIQRLGVSKYVILGVQEYIEAATFYAYNEDQRLASLKELEDALDKGDHIKLKISPLDYILGIADLTGELMRMCINNIGNEELTNAIMQFTRRIHDGFQSFPSKLHNKDMSFKIKVLSQSLKKIENACYTMKVRGTEIPKERLAEGLAFGGGGD
eukprot:TRINITY_DN9984_c0_g2_i3.p1 TRINITY_DN9984_c0_g2~~TRINITY_DN9984_c0_g2_i3.p1  ORF type:complete len:172 (+),score=45.71 TRINITY_DN9984_c0_g2_i3:381-896(+)